MNENFWNDQDVIKAALIVAREKQESISAPPHAWTRS